MEKTVTKMVKGCPRAMKSGHICIKVAKKVLVSNKNVGLCLYMPKNMCEVETYELTLTINLPGLC